MSIKPNFLVRVFSGLVLAPLVVYAIYQGEIFFLVMVLLMALLATLEGVMMATDKRWTPAVIASLLTVPIMIFLVLVEHVALWLLGVILCSLIVYGATRLKAYEMPPRKSLRMIAVVLYISNSLAAGVIIREHPLGLLFWLVMIAGAWSTDTLSYGGGRFYGKTPLVPKLSPNKTVEGALTGIIGAIVIGMIILYQAHAIAPLTVLLVIIAPLTAIAGDLLISTIKRYYHVKDSGIPGLNIVPGHGGLLDRIDSMLMVMICFYPLLALFA